MENIDMSLRQTISNNVEGKAILNAFRFLEDVERQIEALRRAIREQLKQQNALGESTLNVKNVKDDGGEGTQTNSE